MYKIITVRQKGEHRFTLKVLKDGEFVSYTVGAVSYASLGSPPSGGALTEEELSFIEKEDETYRAEKRALGILSFGDVSEAALRMKLIRAGISRDSADSAVKFAVMGGYLNEQRQVERLIEREAKDSLRGPYYIRKKLLSKGYPSHLTSRVMSELVSSGEIDFKEIFEKLCEKTGAVGEERYALAYKRGFKG